MDQNMLGLERSYTTCCIETCGARVNFISTVELGSRFWAIDKRVYVPEMKVSSCGLPTGHRVFYTDCADGTLDYNSSGVDVRFPWASMQNGEALLYAAYPLIELQFQQQRRLTAHSACVSLNGQGILLLGKEGSGKSSVAIGLCLQYGARLMANDLSVLSKESDVLAVIGGTKFLFLRYESVKRNLPGFLRFFPEIKRDTWLSKTMIDPGDVGISTTSESVSIIGSFVVHIDDSQSEVYAETADNLVNRLYLNENFSRYIRGTCLCALRGEDLDFMGYVPSFDLPEFYQWRSELIAFLLSRTLYVSGPLSLVTDYIVNHI